MKSKSISASEALKHFTSSGDKVKGVDVRSEGEFTEGSIPRFANFPILKNSERHAVGICYKKLGQNAAIELGHELVSGEKKAHRTQEWIKYFSNSELSLVTCWRGGLRSKIACDWIADAGIDAVQVEGGYKALRNELLNVFLNLPEFLVLSGATGSGKTQILQKIPASVDLENLAAHKGSAFGANLNVQQPTQSYFENSLALALRIQKSNLLLIEDESRFIGRVQIPNSLKDKMTISSVVKINVPVDDRAKNIFVEYVAEPLAHGASIAGLGQSYAAALLNIKNKLGGLLAGEILNDMNVAFLNLDQELHLVWIKKLLINYYDKMYDFSFNKHSRNIIFEGDSKECKTWIQKKFS